jgi:PAS domain S-box-containing protein
MSMRQRLLQVSVGVALLFLLIFIILVVTTNSIPGFVDRIVGDRLSQTLQNLQHSRDFNLLDARVRILHKTFFEDPEYLERERSELTSKFIELENEVPEREIAELIAQLRADLQIFAAAGDEINALLKWRKEQDTKIHSQVFERLQQIIDMGGRPMPGTVLTRPVDRLILQLSGLRESALEIERDNFEEDLLDLLHTDSEREYPLLADLRGFSSLLQEMVVLDEVGESFRLQLQEELQLYREKMLRYSQLMREQGRRIKSKAVVSDKVLQHMAQLEAQSESIAGEAREDVHKIVQTVLAAILIVLLVTASFFSLIYGKFFKSYFQAPMEKLNQRLESFAQGDMQSQMELGCPGEWLEVENGFNRMLVSLQQKVSALTESETRYRDIFTNAMEGIFRIGLDKNVLEMNPKALELLGYASLEEGLASIDDIRQQLFLTPDVFDEVIVRLHQQGRITDNEAQIKHKDGSLRWVVINAHLVWDEQGNPLYFEGTTRDIQNSKLAQEELQKMHIYLQNIIDAMPSVMIAVDAEMRVTLWNEGAARETAVSAAEALGMQLDKVFDLFQISSQLAANSDKLRDHELIRLLNVEVDKPADGGKKFFDILIYPLSTTGLTGSVIHIDNVTERVGLEEMMVRSEKMQSVGSLASGLAHEINNPLAVILQNCQVLSRRFSLDLAKNRETANALGTDMETVGRYLEQRGCRGIVRAITSAGQRAAKIVENIQSFSRRDMGAFTPSSLELMLEQILELAASDFDMRKKFNFQKIRIVREYSEVESVICEPSQIQQVMLTLLKNAAQAMSRDIEDPVLTLRIIPAGDDYACLQVQDNGAGMEAEVYKRIFDPFYTTRETGSGTGLGLSIAYFIVTQNHDGYLGVRTVPGEGSCFDMLLPYNNAAIARVMMQPEV